MPTYVMDKNGRLFFRRRLPRDLAERLNFQHLTKALPQGRQSDVMMFARLLATYTDHLFQAAMTDQNVTEDDLKSLLQAYYQERLADFRGRKSPYTDENLKYLDDRIQATKKVLRGDTWQDFTPFATSVLKTKGIELEPTSEEFEFFCRGMLRAWQQASKIALAEFDGDYGVVPTDSLFAKPASAPVKPTKNQLTPPDKTFSNFMEVVLREAGLRASAHSVGQKRGRMEMFLKISGDKHVTDYTRADILSYAETLEKLPSNLGKKPAHNQMTVEEIIKESGPRFSATTVEKHFSSVKTVFRAAARETSVNVALLEAVKLGGTEPEKRRPWPVEDLQALFDSPVWRGRAGKEFRQTYKPGAKIFRDEWFWMPLVGLFTGMRLEEIAKLRVCDFRDTNGLRFIDVNADIGRLKTKNSARQVPLHSRLIQIGIDQLLKGDPDSLIFPAFRQGGADGTKFGAKFSRDFGRYRDKINLRKRLMDFHSFRHTFASEIYDKTADIMTVAAICGHTPDETNDLANFKGVRLETYRYVHRSLEHTNEAMQKVRYEGLDLSHLLTQ